MGINWIAEFAPEIGRVFHRHKETVSRDIYPSYLPNNFIVEAVKAQTGRRMASGFALLKSLGRSPHALDHCRGTPPARRLQTKAARIMVSPGLETASANISSTLRSSNATPPISAALRNFAKLVGN